MLSIVNRRWLPAVSLALALSLLVHSCNSLSLIRKKELVPAADLNWADAGPMEVLTRDGSIYSLEQAEVADNYIAGWGRKFLPDGSRANFSGTISMADISIVKTDKPDALASLLVYAAFGVLISTTLNEPDRQSRLDVVITYPSSGSGYWGSCPFVFSHDGCDYRFESETFAGSVCRALEQVVVEPLEYLTEVDGVYRLAVANQLPESQHINQLALQVADHPRGTRVLPDIGGRLHTVSLPIVPLSTVTLKGLEVSQWIAVADNLMWESDFDALDLNLTSDLRDGLICEFERPRESTSAKLLVRCINTFLANFAIDKIFSLRGPNRLQWYHQLDTNVPDLFKLLGWIIREGGLEIAVMVENEWVQQGVVLEVGPHAVSERIVMLDLGAVTSDRVKVKLESASGLWSIDHLALDFSSDEEIVLTNTQLISARTESDREVSGLLQENDTLYYSTLPGDYALLTYSAVPARDGLERTYILKSSGHYFPWLEGTETDDPALVDRILTEPLFGNRLYLPEWEEYLRHNPVRLTGPPEFSVH